MVTTSLVCPPAMAPTLPATSGPAAAPAAPAAAPPATPTVDTVIARARRSNVRDAATAVAFTLLLGATILALF
ncbi:MAG TPA: hypothetical protein VGQ83_08125 [Polyangia bacterium]